MSFAFLTLVCRGQVRRMMDHLAARYSGEHAVHFSHREKNVIPTQGKSAI